MNNKKTLLFWIIFICAFSLTWCQKNNNTEEIIIWEPQTNSWVQEESIVKGIENEINNEKTNNSNNENKKTKKDNTFTYENKKNNFTIEIPTSRSFQEEEYNFEVLINTPKDDEINENLWISVQTPQIKTDLNSYYLNSMKKIEEISENFKEISSNNISANWLEWKSTIYENTQWNSTIKSQQTVFINDKNKVFVLQYTATKDTFDKYINEVNKIINSFKILD